MTLFPGRMSIWIARKGKVDQVPPWRCQARPRRFIVGARRDAPRSWMSTVPPCPAVPRRGRRGDAKRGTAGLGRSMVTAIAAVPVRHSWRERARHPRWPPWRCQARPRRFIVGARRDAPRSWMSTVPPCPAVPRRGRRGDAKRGTAGLGRSMVMAIAAVPVRQWQGQGRAAESFLARKGAPVPQALILESEDRRNGARSGTEVRGGQ
jgi:hypothetical protein